MVIGKSMDAFGGLAMTSVVAGAATGAFAAFHFQRIAAYGLIANLSAMPVFTFWVMPAGVVALGLSPFGLDGPALAVMDAGLRVVLAIAHWTEGLSGSGVPVLAADGHGCRSLCGGFRCGDVGPWSDPAWRCRGQPCRLGPLGSCSHRPISWSRMTGSSSRSLNAKESTKPPACAPSRI
jgi:predicted membrane metal-binding protein